mmetsp:Transcript_9949/g.20723  ORF Transcript_9949/g.20723 Transcript_9949/m.20723 type:complete len:297 (-) Transcript_9949:434-1324(-)
MNRTPSLCGGFLNDKRSMVAFVWSVTTVLTIFAFSTAIVLTVKVHTHYKYLERVYEGDDWYQASDAYYNYDDKSQEENGSEDERYREQIRESFMLLSSMSAKSVTFVAVYTMILATSLSMYGSMAIVGFTSLRGVYIAPCLPIGTNKLRVGIFGGMIVIFANLLLVCAVVLGEVKVNMEQGEQDENMNGEGEPYEVERIATILAVTFIFLSALYTIFAVLLFLCHAGEEQSILRIERGGGGVGIGSHMSSIRNGIPAPGKTTPLVGVGGKRLQTTTLGDGEQGFITMDNSSQGTAD